MTFSILRLLGLKKKRPILTKEQIAERRKRIQSEGDPLGGDNDDGFGGDGNGGSDGDGGGEGGGEGY